MAQSMGVIICVDSEQTEKVPGVSGCEQPHPMVTVSGVVRVRHVAGLHVSAQSIKRAPVGQRER